MDLLFKRQQDKNSRGKVRFRLWGRVELNEDEQEILKRYGFDQAELVYVPQPGLFRNAVLLALLVAAIVGVLLLPSLGNIGLIAGLLAGNVAGYIWYDRRRESVFVKDLLHGRYFTCDNVIDLARKEAWLGYVVAFFRQVMESAKHWDGSERLPVDALPPDEARQVIIRGL